VEITSPTHLALIADLTDAPVSELLALNPALLKGVAPAGYALRVPKSSADALVASLQLIPPAHRASWRMHTVASGETLASIGRLYGAAPRSIAEANRLQSESPITGDHLVIPAAYLEKHSRAKTVTRRAGVRKATSHRARSRSAARRARKRPAILTHTASNGQPPAASGQ
jgi:membrane-bound lytic murein transglycosylase D